MELPRDLEALITLCRSDLGVGDQSSVGDVDADALTKLAQAHRLTAVAERGWRALAARSRAPDVPAVLRDAAAHARRRSLLAAGHLARLARAFETAGVAFRALKGPALSLQLYGDASIRTVRDLDVLVQQQHLAAAVAAAESAGWSVPANWSRLSHLTGRYEIELRPTMRGQPILEIHTAFGPRYAQFALDAFAACEHGSVALAGAAIPTLAGETQAAYVAWHGARGFWYRLAWLVDYARLLPRDESNARRLLATARRCQAEAAVRGGALMAHRLFGVEPPPWPAASPRMTARVETLLAWSLERLSLGVEAPAAWLPPGSHRWLWREVAQQPSRWRAVAGALNHLTRPTRRDAEQLGTSLPLAIHRLARPLFVARRVLRPAERDLKL